MSKIGPILKKLYHKRTLMRQENTFCVNQYLPYLCDFCGRFCYLCICQYYHYGKNREKIRNFLKIRKIELWLSVTFPVISLITQAASFLTKKHLKYACSCVKMHLFKLHYIANKLVIHKQSSLYIKYTRPCITNRIWGLKQLWLQMIGHAWFHLHGHCWAVRKGEGAKTQNENICLQRDSNSRHANPRQVNQRFRVLGQDAVMRISDLKSYRIVG